MTQNWEFSYLSPGFNEQSTAYLYLYDAFRNIQSDITYYTGANAGKISYPFFKVRFWGLDVMSHIDMFPADTDAGFWHRGVMNTLKPTTWGATDGSDVKENFLSMGFYIFDNLGDVTYDEDITNGYVNISRYFAGSQMFKFDVIECSEQNVNADKEIGVIKSGMINIINRQNPQSENYQYGETDANQLSHTDSRFKEYNLNRGI